MSPKPITARILVVDDDEDIQRYLGALLSENGYEVLLASNGRECLDLARKHVPDLILLDVIMPEMSGGLTAHRLTENTLTRDIPVIFLTAMLSRHQEITIEYLKGTYLFLSKPIEDQRVLEEVGRVLRAAPPSVA